MEVPDGTEEMVAELFDSADYEGFFTLHLGKFVAGTPHTKGVSARSLDKNRRVIMLRVQPGNNTTNQMLKFRVPDGADPDEFFRRLKEAEDKIEIGTKLARWEKKARRLYRMVKGENFSLETISQTALDELDWTLETLSEVFESLARHHRFVKVHAKKPGCFEWLPDFREKMVDSGYNPDGERPSASPFPEEEREEDQLVNRLLTIEEEMRRIGEKETVLESEKTEMASRLRQVQASINDLLRQAQQQNSVLEKIRKEEESISKQEGALKHQRKVFESDERKINDKLAELEKKKNVEQACATAGPALDNLSLAEQAQVLENLLKNRPELAGLAAEILQKSQPAPDPTTPAE